MAQAFKQPANRLRWDLEEGEDVWVFVNRLRVQHNAINHGQGFPNWKAPDFVKKAATTAIMTDYNQYSSNVGHLPLRTQIAKGRTKMYGGKYKLTPNNVQVTHGCSGALDSCFRAFVNPGDEVIAIEPFFTFYRTQIYQSGGTLKTVPLRLDTNSKDDSIWTLDTKALSDAISDDTRLLVLNSPHNPTGYVMSLDEMLEIASIVRQHPKLLVITDEVYHYISSDDVHYFAAIDDDIFDRTISCCSAAKTFSVTGWKIGWAVGPQQLIQYVGYSSRGHSAQVNTPCQQAMSTILVEAQRPYHGFTNYYLWLNDMYQHKKELMLKAIQGSGMKAIVPKGAYYIMVDASKWITVLRKRGLFRKLDLSDPTSFYDWQFVQWMIEKVGVAVIPGSAFCDYSRFDEDSEFKYIRFAYCMSDDTICKTAEKLKSIPKLLSDALMNKMEQAEDEEEKEKEVEEVQEEEEVQGNEELKVKVNEEKEGDKEDENVQIVQDKIEDGNQE